ncbi:tetraacyldisaccharide 4'-kinase [Vibrio sp. HB161653]|uniref:Tetraacyldisaccharide 4'-kinase n=2 Tax=unclassified Vibrio TaxID=2614977 RepID=A0AB39HE47_9VIBR|nr:tetraacyldisaccharide 4'-kinase [Vibrio sp. HB161653]MDP5255105.1 tetraacyldisaccharide 4'-kinase [Vibrio sp. HB161653]
MFPLSQVFGLVSRRRRQSYQSGKKTPYRPPVPIVVVGNITAGGNGKTPVVIALVEALQQQGFCVGVVSRGYGGKSTSYPLLVQKSTSSLECGDEPKLIHERTKAHVAVAPKRAEAVKALLPLGVQVIITDDGLQHYALARDIELIVVDGQRRFGNGLLIPAGPMRESLSRLDDVDFVIANGAAEHGELAMTLEPGKAVNLVTGEQKPVDELPPLCAFAGIGHPPRFFSTLREQGAKLVASHGFADHKAYTEQDIIALENDASTLIMTEKDAVKCLSFARENWWYLPVTARFCASDHQKVMLKIQEVIKEYGPPLT